MAAQHRNERDVVVGLFQEPMQVDRAVQELRAAGFDKGDISIAAHDSAERRVLDSETGVRVHESGASVLEGGASGFFDTIASWFNPDRSEDLAGALTAHGFSAEEASRFEQGFRSGMVLVAVRAHDRGDRAAAVLEACGADLGLSEMPGAATVDDASGARAGASRPADEDLTESERIALREEQLRIQKEQVQTGEVRVRKEVVTEQQQIDVPVTREEVVIERRPVTGEPARSGDIANLREGEEIRVPIMEEQVRVEKTPVVKEEVSVRKQQVQETRHVRDEVRHEEARVETTGDVHRLDAETTEPWRGNERRYHADASYSGPERRAAHA